MRKTKLNIARHVIRYISRHIRRSVVKSLLAVGLALLLAGTVGMMTMIRATNESAFENVQIKAHILGGIVTTYAMQLSNSGLVASSYYESIIFAEHNTVAAKIVMTNNVERFCGAAVEIEFLEGYDYKSLTGLSPMPNNICVMDSDLMDAFGVGLGDKLQLNSEFTRVVLTTAHLMPPAEDDEARNVQMEKFAEALKNSSVFLTVIGKKTPGSTYNTIYAPVSSGTGSIMQLLPSDARALDLVEYGLASPSYIDDFRKLAESKIIGTVGGIGSPFVMDTSEADNIERMLQLLNAFYPIAVAAEAVLGGLFPGLIVMQSAKDAAVMRALGMPKRRTRAVLTIEQAVLCLLGLLLAIALLFVINGAAIAALAASLAMLGAIHFAACVAGAVIFAVLVTMRRPLELLQVKE